MSTPARKSNIELLRIVAMLMIVGHHFSVHSGFSFPEGTLTLNRLWLQLLQYGGKIGVDLFVLITGYFSVTSQKFKTEKLIKLWLSVVFWSVVTLIVFVAFGLQEFNGFALWHRLFPIVFQEYWFVSAYFVLILLSPFINRLLAGLSEKQHRLLMILLIVLWSVIPTLSGMGVQSNDLLWFACLYVFAAYLQLHGALPAKAGKVRKERKSGAYFLFAGATVLLVMGLTAGFDALKLTGSFFRDYLYHMQMLPVFIASVFIFQAFLKLPIGHSRVINLIASAAFGVYLIHDNYYVRVYIWKTLFRNPTYTDSALLIPHSLWVIAAVFAGGTLLELFRIYLIERPVLPLVRRVAEGIEKRVRRILNRSE